MSLRVLPVVLFVVICGFFWHSLSLNPHDLPLAQLGHALPSFELPVLNQPTEHLTAQSIQKERFALLNVWASWCAACTDEQVFLMDLSQQGIPIYGINYKDNAKEATKWLTEWGNPYQIIGQDKEGRVAINLGVYGAPETFLIDKHNMIRYRYAGVLNAEVWQQKFVPIIQQLEQ